MMNSPISNTIDVAWVDTLGRILTAGNSVAPRGKETLEIPQHTVFVDTRQCVLLNQLRKLSYRFMTAEAYWILSGDDRVSTIAPFNSRIAEFSDDGEKFFGAYGPRIHAQFDYVVDKLLADQVSRQAGMTIWRENPQPSKDIPCTVAIWFQIRRVNPQFRRDPGRLHLNCHVFMRSSDVWLGLPYDVFNFSMLTHMVAADINVKALGNSHECDTPEIVIPGDLYLTAASSHLYKENADAAIAAFEHGSLTSYHASPTPEHLFSESDDLLDTLKGLRDKDEDFSPWWSGYTTVATKRGPTQEDIT